MKFIYSIGKVKNLFFLPTIFKIELLDGRYAIILAWLHRYIGFRIEKIDKP